MQLVKVGPEGKIVRADSKRDVAQLKALEEKPKMGTERRRKRAFMSLRDRLDLQKGVHKLSALQKLQAQMIERNNPKIKKHLIETAYKNFYAGGQGDADVEKLVQELVRYGADKDKKVAELKFKKQHLDYLEGRTGLHDLIRGTFRDENSSPAVVAQIGTTAKLLGSDVLRRQEADALFNELRGMRMENAREGGNRAIESQIQHQAIQTAGNELRQLRQEAANAALAAAHTAGATEREVRKLSTLAEEWVAGQGYDFENELQTIENTHPHVQLRSANTRLSSIDNIAETLPISEEQARIDLNDYTEGRGPLQEILETNTNDRSGEDKVASSSALGGEYIEQNRTRLGDNANELKIKNGIRELGRFLDNFSISFSDKIRGTAGSGDEAKIKAELAKSKKDFESLVDKRLSEIERDIRKYPSADLTTSYDTIVADSNLAFDFVNREFAQFDEMWATAAPTIEEIGEQALASAANISALAPSPTTTSTSGQKQNVSNAYMDQVEKFNAELNAYMNEVKFAQSRSGQQNAVKDLNNYYNKNLPALASIQAAIAKDIMPNATAAEKEAFEDKTKRLERMTQRAKELLDQTKGIIPVEAFEPITHQAQAQSSNLTPQQVKDITEQFNDHATEFITTINDMTEAYRQAPNDEQKQAIRRGLSDYHNMNAPPLASTKEAIARNIYPKFGKAEKIQFTTKDKLLAAVSERANNIIQKQTGEYTVNPIEELEPTKTRGKGKGKKKVQTLEGGEPQEGYGLGSESKTTKRGEMLFEKAMEIAEGGDPVLGISVLTAIPKSEYDIVDYLRVYNYIHQFLEG
jgi:hypothetical protein